MATALNYMSIYNSQQKKKSWKEYIKSNSNFRETLNSQKFTAKTHFNYEISAAPRAVEKCKNRS